MADHERCARCDDAGWVCVNHPDRPWEGTSKRADVCPCGAEGVQCPDCNADGHKTGMVEVFIDTKHGWRN